MCECEEKLNELQGQLSALRVALALKLTEFDIDRLVDVYRRGREAMPFEAKGLYDEIDGDMEWFTSTLIQIRIMHELFRDLGWKEIT